MRGVAPQTLWGVMTLWMLPRRAKSGPPRPPARPMPAAAAENSRAMDPALASVTWSDLERISPVVWRRATRRAREFGYDY